MVFISPVDEAVIYFRKAEGFSPVLVAVNQFDTGHVADLT